MSDQWTERLSEYLDGDLTDAEEAALEAHLESCAACAETLAGLRRIVARGRGRSRTGRPRAISGPASRRGSAPVRAAAGSPSRCPSCWPPGSPSRSSREAAPGCCIPARRGSRRSRAIPRPRPVAPVAAAGGAGRSYDSAVDDLERVLAEGRGRLDTTTVRVLEQNLALIDRAIAQARRAVAADSANVYLNTHLAETMRRKIDLLRQAAALVSAVS